MRTGSQLFPLNLHYSGGGGGGDYDLPGSPRPTGGGGGDEDPCALEFMAVLQSLNLQLVSQLVVGLHLSVEIVAENGRERVCATLNGQVIGAIVSPFVPQVIACMHKGGNRYEAKVTEIAGNQYRVRVSRT